jgi:hypothetical protein
MNAAAQHQFAIDQAVAVGDFEILSNYSTLNIGVIARHEAPKLRFNKSMPLELVRDSIDKWNAAIQESFEGHGYYAFSPMDEEETPNHHVLVLFANQPFYKAFMGSVIEIDFSNPAIFDRPTQVPVFVEEISYDDVKLPWE